MRVDHVLVVVSAAVTMATWAVMLPFVFVLYLVVYPLRLLIEAVMSAGEAD